jgi:hypothetical protein
MTLAVALSTLSSALAAATLSTAPRGVAPSFHHTPEWQAGAVDARSFRWQLRTLELLPPHVARAPGAYRYCRAGVTLSVAYPSLTDAYALDELVARDAQSIAEVLGDVDTWARATTKIVVVEANGPRMWTASVAGDDQEEARAVLDLPISITYAEAQA